MSELPSNHPKFERTNQLRPEPEQSSPEVEFFNVEHGTEDAEKVWSMVQDSDVILTESIRDDPQEGERLVEDVQDLFASESKDTKEEELRHLLLTYPDFSYRIMARAAKAGKEFHFIDITGNEKKLFEEAHEIDANFKLSQNMFRIGKAQEAYRMYQRVTDKLATIVPQRDTYILNELEEKIAGNPEWRGKKVAVIQGATHSSTYHQFKDKHPGWSVGRSFGEMPFFYDYMNALARKKYMRPEMPIAEEEYQRAFLGDLIVEPHLDRSGMENLEMRRTSLKVLKELDREQLGRAIIRFEQLYRKYVDALKDIVISDDLAQELSETDVQRLATQIARQDLTEELMKDADDRESPKARGDRTT